MGPLVAINTKGKTAFDFAFFVLGAYFAMGRNIGAIIGFSFRAL